MRQGWQTTEEEEGWSSMLQGEQENGENNLLACVKRKKEFGVVDTKAKLDFPFGGRVTNSLA